MAVSFVDSTITIQPTQVASIAPDAPAGVQADDFLIVVASFSKATLPTWSAATYTGWTTLRDITGEAAISTRVLTRVADGTSADTPPTMAVSAVSAMISTAAAYRGVDTATPFIAENGQVHSAASSTSHPAPALVNTDAGAWAVFAGHVRQVATPLTWTPPTGMVEREDADMAIAGTANTAATWADTNGSVATGTVTYTGTTNGASAQADMWAAFLLPATVAGTTPVSASTSDTYAVRQAITDSISDTYAVRQAITASRSELWDVAAPTGAQSLTVAGPPWLASAAVTSLTTAAFTPAAGSVLLSLSMFDTATTTRTEATTTITGSTSAWTKLQHQNTGGGLADANWATVTASASTTVRSTWPASSDGALWVPAITGADSTTPIGQSGAVSATTTTAITLTATRAGSIVFVGYGSFNGGTVPSSAQLTAAGSTTTNWTAAAYQSAPLAAGSNTITLTGCTAGAALVWVEVVPSAGSVTAVTGSVSDTFAVRAPVAASATDTFAVRTAISASSRTDTYAVRSTTTSTSTDTYGVRAVATSSRTDTYAVATTLVRTNPDTWSVAKAVAASAADTWAVRSFVTDATTDTYGVRQVVSRSVSDSFNVLAIGSVIGSVSDTYVVRAVATGTASDTYAVRITLSANRSETYAIRSGIASGRTDSWAVLAGVQQTRSASWAVSSRVTAARADAWNIVAGAGGYFPHIPGTAVITNPYIGIAVLASQE